MPNISQWNRKFKLNNRLNCDISTFTYSIQHFNNFPVLNKIGSMKLELIHFLHMYLACTVRVFSPSQKKYQTKKTKQKTKRKNQTNKQKPKTYKQRNLQVKKELLINRLHPRKNNYFSQLNKKYSFYRSPSQLMKNEARGIIPNCKKSAAT